MTRTLRRLFPNSCVWQSKRLAQHPRKGSRLSALELQLVIQGGRRIGQKTRQLGASATIRRPVLRPLDWLFIATRGLFKQLPG